MATSPRLPTIVEFVRTMLGLSLSPAQETLLRAIYGLPLESAEQEAIFQQCTGRGTYTPGKPFSEVTVLAGRRSGKDSRIAAPIACYEAIFGGHEPYLGRGEAGVIPLVAQDERGTRIAYKLIHRYLTDSPLLSRMVKDVRQREIDLTNGLSVYCFACSAKSLRGWGSPAAVMDEVAFFRTEAGTVVDDEVQSSIRGAGVAFPQQRLVKISTPNGKSGVLWEDFKRYWAQDAADVLVWHAPTTLMNPTVTDERLAREYRRDAKKAGREYEALFVDDVEAFLTQAHIETAIAHGRSTDLAPIAPRPYYVAGVDPSGGVRDAFALSVCHVEDGTRIVQDLVRAWKPSRTEKARLSEICAEIAALIRPYGIASVTGDKYAAQWVSQEFQRVGVSYTPYDGDKSSAYLAFEPFMTSGRVEVIDDAEQVRELTLLEKHLRVGGKPPRIDHPKGSHDDLANTLALCVATLAPNLSPAVDVSVAPPTELVTRPGMRLGQAPDLEDPDRTGRTPTRFWSERGRARFWRQEVAA